MRYWSQLESRTHQTIELLRLAAEGKCGWEENPVTEEMPTRSLRKARERRKKAHSTIEELLERGGDGLSRAARETMFEPLAELLEQRSQMRALWIKREKDHVFRELRPEFRPLNLPIRFSVLNHRLMAEESGVSPLPGQPEALMVIAQNLRAYGKAFTSGKICDLPRPTSELREPVQNAKSRKEIAEDEHAKSLDWPGWSEHKFGLELQAPWAAAVVSGRKRIETRLYNLPPALMGKRIHIIQTPVGTPGLSAMRDFIDFRKSDAKMIGWSTFTSVKKYACKEDFEADENLHLVTRDSEYGWKDGQTKILYGWVVGKFAPSRATSDGRFGSATRRMRSLFQLNEEYEEDGALESPKEAKDSKQMKLISKPKPKLKKKRKKRHKRY